MELEPHAVIDGRYTVEGLIGEGGMASVYRVRHNHLGTQHALKAISVSRPSVRRRLMQEGRVQATLRHVNVVAVTDVVDINGGPGLVMEYIDGPALDELLDSMKLTLPQIDALARGILNGVTAAHELALIHRDLKPANVMLAISQGRLIPKVTDFGLVKLLADGTGDMASKTRSGAAMGTPAYMAPEQIRDAKTVDVRADVWSLGAILFEMVAGVRPFDGDDLLDLMFKVAHNQRPLLRDLVPDAPSRMVDAIEGALTLDRKQRISDVPSLAEIWIGGQPLATESPWRPAFLERCRALGSGGEDERSFLERSFRSDSPLVSKGFFSPVPDTASRNSGDTQPTRVPDFDHSGEPEDEDGGALHEPPSVVGPPVIPSPPRTPSLNPMSLAPPAKRREKAPVRGYGPWATGGLVMLALGAFTLLGVVLGRNAVDPAPVEPRGPAPVVVIQEPVDQVAAPVPEPTELEEADPQPTPVPAASPRPRPSPRPAPAPAAAPAPAEPGPGEADEEPAEVAPAPVPVSAPVPAPAGPMVRVDSDVTVLLRRPGGETVEPSSASAGHYQVVAFFVDQQPTVAGDVELRAGSTVEIRCKGAQARCVIR